MFAAAHCFENENKTFSAKDLSVVIGNQTHDVATLNKHPNWNSNETKNEVDIVILVLSKSIIFSESIQPILIPPKDKIVRGEGFVAGLESDDKNSTSLTQFSSSALNSTQCAATFPEAEKLSSDHVFCANVPHLICKTSEFFYQTSTNGSWVILGISSAKGCDLNLNVSMFTIVSHFEDWINDVME